MLKELGYDNPGALSSVFGKSSGTELGRKYDPLVPSRTAPVRLTYKASFKSTYAVERSGIGNVTTGLGPAARRIRA